MDTAISTKHSQSHRLSKAIKMGLVGCALAGATAATPAFASAKFDISEDAWISLGAGVRFSATAVEDNAPNGDDWSKDFDIDSLRLYINGQVNQQIGFTFNTEDIKTDGEEHEVNVLDAIIRLEFSDALNIHLGRHLVPADRIEMNGPYYGLSWNQYTQPLYASDQLDAAGTYGRDDGVTFWGKVGKFQYAIGAFEGLSSATNDSDSLLYAGRFAYNFLNMEANPAYYTSSTYYGGLNDIFTVALSFNSQSDGVGTPADPGDFNGYSVDAFYEGVLDNGGVINVEAEYKEFDSDHPTGAPNDAENFGLFDGDSYFATLAYLFPGDGYGRFQPYIRYVSNNPSDVDGFEINSGVEATDNTELTEFGVNYVIKGHNARINLNYSTGDANISGFKLGDEVDAISFGIQLQI